MKTGTITTRGNYEQYRFVIPNEDEKYAQRYECAFDVHLEKKQDGSIEVYSTSIPHYDLKTTAHPKYIRGFKYYKNTTLNKAKWDFINDIVANLPKLQTPEEIQEFGEISGRIDNSDFVDRYKYDICSPEFSKYLKEFLDINPRSFKRYPDHKEYADLKRWQDYDIRDFDNYINYCESKHNDTALEKAKEEYSVL